MATDDFFRARLDQMVDLRHALAVQATRMSWAQISRFRRVLGEAGVEQLLKTTIEAAVAMGGVKKTEFERVIVDSTVQSKAIAYPADIRRLLRAIAQLGLGGPLWLC